MFAHPISSGLGAVLLLAAASRLSPPTWTARLEPAGNSGVSGTASVSALGPDSAAATVMITGAKPGQYPWHVHSGTCGSLGPMVGSEASYPVISVSTGGKASVQTTFAFKPLPGADYSVNVHRSKTDQTVIACGGLKESGEMSDSLRAPVKHDSAQP